MSNKKTLEQYETAKEQFANKHSTKIAWGTVLATAFLGGVLLSNLIDREVNKAENAESESIAETLHARMDDFALRRNNIRQAFAENTAASTSSRGQRWLDDLNEDYTAFMVDTLTNPNLSEASLASLANSAVDKGLPSCVTAKDNQQICLRSSNAHHFDDARKHVGGDWGVIPKTETAATSVANSMQEKQLLESLLLVLGGLGLSILSLVLLSSTHKGWAKRIYAATHKKPKATPKHRN